MGNQLNARTHRGNARGFELSTLKELAKGTKHGIRPTLTVTLTVTLTLTLTLTLDPSPSALARTLTPTFTLTLTLP